MAKPPNQDGPKPIEDDEGPFWVKWDRDKTADLKLTKVDTEHEDLQGVPCTALVGELLQPLDGHDVGEIAHIGGAQMKLKRLIDKGVNAGLIKVGERCVIKRVGMLGRMINFEVIPGGPIDLSQFPGTPRDEKPPF